MPNQRGFLSIPIVAALAAGAVILALGLALKVQGARLDAKEAELEACTTRYAETLKLVDIQNKAVESLESEAKKRATIAAAALAKAREGRDSLNAEIARLRAATGSGRTCAEAVSEVRKGLKP